MITAINGLLRVRTPPGGTAGPVVSYTDTATSTTDTDTYSFASRAIGGAALDRYVVVGIFGRSSTVGTLAVSSVTVGGVSASLVRANTLDTGGGTSSNCVELWIAAVPTGTTATIDVVFNTTSLRCAVAVYKLTGVTGSATSTNVYANNSSGTSLSLNVNVDSDSVVVSMAAWAGSVSASWTGASENVEADLEVNHYTAASYTSTSTQTPRSITAIPASSTTQRLGTIAVFD